jgi:hypothetical protein
MKVLTSFLLVILLAASVSAGPKQKRKDNELLEAIRRAQTAAEQAQEEAHRARERSDELLNQLEMTNRLLAALRTEVAKRNGTEIALQPASPDSGAAAYGDAAPRSPQSPAAGALSDRVTKIEEQLDINSTQIKEQAQTKVESESRFCIRLSGMILANLYYNSNDIQRVQPLAAMVPSPLYSSSRSTFGSTFRQTQIGLQMEGPHVAGARLTAHIDTDFYGGPVGTYDGDALGVFRIRTAGARLDWERTSVVVGQESPIISPLNPTSLAQVWFPPLSNAGNLWQWRPQVTFEHRPRLSPGTELVTQVSALFPTGESVNGMPLAAQPSVESRLAIRHTLDSDKKMEFGVAGHYERFGFSRNRAVDGYVVSGDWQVPLGRSRDLSGEFYFGRSVSLGGITGGRIDRLFAFSGPVDDPATHIAGIHSTGGWVQLGYQLRREIDFNLAYGQESPRHSDIRLGIVDPATRFRNQSVFANVIYQVRPSFLLSLEFRRLWTDYQPGRSTNNQVNMAVAYVF